ncbi:MAG: restriction endonuclease [Bacteroidales bacterium]
MIPDYQKIMLPLLQKHSDKEEHNFWNLVEELSQNFKLSEEEQKELLPSGQATIIANRVGWARTYLKKAGLIESPKRRFTKITQRGSDVLMQNIHEINISFLKQFPEFVEFQNLKHEGTEGIEPVEMINQTPEENLEIAYQRLRKSLAQDLINRVIELSPSFFERLVVELLVSMGYGGSIKDAGKAIGKIGDEAIDGTIKEDKLGLDIIYIQAKRWQPGNIVARPEIQKFVGALAGQGAKKGIFITTSSFTKEAQEYSPKNETKIVLINGEQLAQLMIDHNIGVSTVNIYELKRIDNDYFGDE